MPPYPKTIAFALGCVSALGFAPLGWWPLTLIAFAAWMALVRVAETRRSALARGYWFGVGHFTVGLNWIAGSFRYQETMPVWLGWFAVVALALYIAVYPAMAAGLAWRWGRGPLPSGEGDHAQHGGVAGAELGTTVSANSHGAPPPASLVPLPVPGRIGFALIFAAAWTVTEWLRATMFTGFAWNPLAAAFVSVRLVSGHSSWIGTYGASGLSVLFAGLLWHWATNQVPGYPAKLRQMGREGTWPTAIFAPALLVALVWVAFIWEPPGKPREGGPLIRIVQPNIGQQDKYEPGYEAINFTKLARLTGKPGPEPRLIFWPEAAIPDYLDETDDDAAEARARIARLMGPRDVILTGGVKRHFKRTKGGAWWEDELIGARNAVFGMNASGKLLFRYDKAHLVPYGEYLPMQPVLSLFGLTRLVPGTVDFWPGPGPQSHAIPGFGKAGFQICYEIVFSGEVVDRANRPDFLFNPSNDAWFGAWGPPQHLAQARLRAIEEGIPVIRSTPTGISAVIDADGTVLHSLPYQKPGFIETNLPPAHGPTLFARYGNILSFAFALLLAALGVAFNRRSR